MSKKTNKNSDNSILRTYKITVKKGHRMFNYFSNLCFLSKNLYNTSNYYIRQYLTGKQRLQNNLELLPSQEDIIHLVDYYTNNTKYQPIGNWLNYNTLDYIFKTMKYKDYYALPSHTNQGIMEQLWKIDYSSFFEAIRDFKINPQKYKSMPKLPKYKKKNSQSTLYFSNLTCKIKDNKYLRFPKTKEQLNIGKLGDMGKLKQIRVLPHKTYYIVEVILELSKQSNNTIENHNTPKRVISIDLGISNFCAITNNISKQPILIKGNCLKSINQYFNKRLAYYKSIAKKLNGLDYTNRIDRLYRKRNNKIYDYMHKVSRLIVDYCIYNKIDTVIIGKNNQWKDNINIGKRNNQQFVEIPHALFIKKLQYKLEEVNIKLIIQEESYTSKASFLDKDEIPCFGEDNIPKFSGRRISRGVYKTKEGIKINADLNGSGNIMRKAIPCVINNSWDRGIVDMPLIVINMEKSIA